MLKNYIKKNLFDLIWIFFKAQRMEKHQRKKLSWRTFSVSFSFSRAHKMNKNAGEKRDFYNHVFLSPFLFPYINFGIMIYWDNETAMFKKAHTNGKRDFCCVQKVKSLKIESFVCFSCSLARAQHLRRIRWTPRTSEYSQKKIAFHDTFWFIIHTLWMPTWDDGGDAKE